MKWNDIIHQPVSRITATQPQADSDRWLTLVHDQGLMRTRGDRPVPASAPEECPETLLGEFFRPEAEISLDVLQVAGLLLCDGKLDRELAAFSARRAGGGLYFNWFLAQLDPALQNPLPAQEFPLHRSRWQKPRAGRRRSREKQRVHTQNT